MRIIFKWWNFKCTLQKFQETIHLRFDSLEKKKKENPIIPFHDPFSLSTPNYRSVAVHRDPRAGIPSWKLSMHLQTWLLLSRHQIHQSILQWHRYRGRIRKVDDGEFPSFFSLWNTFAKIPSVYFLFVSQITTVENFICKKDPF